MQTEINKYDGGVSPHQNDLQYTKNSGWVVISKLVASIILEADCTQWDLSLPSSETPANFWDGS